MANRILNPQLYVDVFEDDRRGAAILKELVIRFGSTPFVKGGHEAERETCRNIGRREVIEFILSKIEKAHISDDQAEQEAE